MRAVSPEMLDRVIPDGWKNPFFGWELNLDWSGILESANEKIAADGWSLFGLFFMMMLFKGFLQSSAGPAPNYDMQRILSARTPKEAAKMSGLVSLVLLVPRYMLVAGLTILALAFFMGDLEAMGSSVDFELILPFAMSNFIPAGLLGLLIASLIAAFMSTYAATVNAAPAYIVNDIYKRYIRKDAPEKVYVRMSYLVSVAVVIVGTSFGFFIGSLNDIVQWIVAALYGGYTASNLLKWYWWRFNSYGYFWGMLAGILAAMIVPALLPDMTPIYGFPVILALSVIGCIAGTLLTPADPDEVLDAFYLKVRPWGFWKPVRERLQSKYPQLEGNRDFGLDMFNVVVGIIWQTALTAIGIFIVTGQQTELIIAVVIVLISSGLLKKLWYDRLQDYPVEVQVEEES